VRSYSLRETIAPAHYGAHALAVDLVHRVAHLDAHGDEVRCHELARAVLRVLHDVRPDVRALVVDGRCGYVDHSWLRLEPVIFAKHAAQRASGPFVLDVYAPGSSPQVLLLAASHGIDAAYVPGPPRRDVRDDVVDHLVAQMLLYPLDHLLRARGTVGPR